MQELAQEIKQLGGEWGKARAWKQAGFTPAETQAWLAAGATNEPEFVSYLQTNNYTPETAFATKNLAQTWLDWQYPPEGTCIRKNKGWWRGVNNYGKQRCEITDLDISRQNLVGSFDLSDFVNLEELNCSENQLIKIILPLPNQLKKITANDNSLTAFDYGWLNPEILTELELKNNNLVSTDIEIFSRLVNLARLEIGNEDSWMKIDSDNKDNNEFYGSLESLKNLTKLSHLNISKTNIDSGLEYLSESLEYFDCQGTELAKQLENYGKPEYCGGWSNCQDGEKEFSWIYKNYSKLLKEWKLLRKKDREELIAELLKNTKKISDLEDLLKRLKENKSESIASDIGLWDVRQKIERKITRARSISGSAYSEDDSVKYCSGEEDSDSQKYFKSQSKSIKYKKSPKIPNRSLPQNFEDPYVIPYQFLKNQSDKFSSSSDSFNKLEGEFMDRDIRNLQKIEQKLEEIEKLKKDNEELLAQKSLFDEQEEEIKYLEARIKELIDLIKQQKNKIMSVFLRLFPEKDLLQELIATHLESTRFKLKEMESPDYGRKCREYKKTHQKIEDELESKVDEETMNEIQRILTDCEELVNQEIELEKKLNSKTQLIESQKQILQITNDEDERKIVQEHEKNHHQQLQRRRDTIYQLELELAKAKSERDSKIEENARLWEQLNKPVALLTNEPEEIKEVLSTNLPINVYQLSLELLKAKDYFYLARKNTINNLQTQMQALENQLKIIDKVSKGSEFIINVGNSTKTLDYGITSAVGSSLKAGINLLSSTYTSKQGKKIHLIFQNSEKEISSLQQLDFAYSQLNSSLQGNKDHDLFGLLDSRHHQAFKTDYLIYDILNNQISIWEDRSLNRERLEKIYMALQANLTQLNEEINSEFLKLKSEDQTQIRKENEQKLANQVKTTDQEQRIKELQEQINIKEKKLRDLIISTKLKLESKKKFISTSERTKITQERHKLLEQFIEKGFIDSTLQKIVKEKNINLAETTELQVSLQNLQEQLTSLQQQPQIEVNPNN